MGETSERFFEHPFLRKIAGLDHTQTQKIAATHLLELQNLVCLNYMGRERSHLFKVLDTHMEQAIKCLPPDGIEQEEGKLKALQGVKRLLDAMLDRAQTDGRMRIQRKKEDHSIQQVDPGENRHWTYMHGSEKQPDSELLRYIGGVYNSLIVFIEGTETTLKRMQSQKFNLPVEELLQEALPENGTKGTAENEEDDQQIHFDEESIALLDATVKGGAPVS